MIDPGHGQGVGGYIRGIDPGIREGHGTGDGDTATAGADLQNVLNLFIAQPGLKSVVYQLGNGGTGYQHPLIDIKGQAGKPGLVRQVGGGFLLRDATL